MNSLAYTRQVALILIAAPFAWLVVAISWMVLQQVAQAVVVKVVEAVATGS
jgi:hypothetical protein